MGIFSKLFGGSAKATPLKPGRGWTFEIHGESKCQQAIQSSYARHGGNGHDLKVQAVIMPDHGNSTDPNAVKVEIDGRVVGYVPRDLAPDYRAAVGDMVGSCGAKIVGGYLKEGDTWAMYGVKLNLKWPPVPMG